MFLTKSRGMFHARSTNGKEQRQVSLKTQSKKEAMALIVKFQQVCDRKQMSVHANIHKLLEMVGDKQYHAGSNFLTLSESIDLFLSEKKYSLKKTSYDTYEYQLHAYRKSFRYDISVGEIVPDDLVNYIRNDKWAPATQRNRMRHLRAWWNFLLEEEYVREKFPKIKLPKVATDTTVKMSSRAELDEIIKFHRHKLSERKSKKHYHQWQDQNWFEPLMLLLFFSGTRINELLSLKVVDVDMEKGIVKVQAENSKNSKARYIPIPDEVVEAIQGHIRRASRKRYELLFELTSDHVYRVFKRYVKELGIPDKTLHGFRHNRVTAWLQMGFSTIEAAQMAGHSNLSVTMGYSHMAAEKLREKMERLSH